MVKLTAVIACLLVSFDCVEKAIGAQSQTMVSAGMLWVWWIIAAAWAANAVLQVVNPPRR